MQKIISFVLGLFTALSLAAEGIPYAFQPTVEIDASIVEDDISTRATGYLYGIAQSGVPDEAIVESLDISSVSQKVIGGLQHPIGDVDDVSNQLDSCDYIVVYLQDSYDTWYYCHEQIAQMRRNGTYDCMEFMRSDFLPRVTEKVTQLSRKDYADRIVYCPYNECDNAVWFGTESEDGTWYMFDGAAKQRFYAAWKETCELIRRIHPDALIGGPGYCDYDYSEIRDFLEYGKENGCLPDIMIYHELGATSSLFWQDHVDEYRSMEAELGIEELPIIITEYGTMEECGAPSDMLHYMVAIEESGVYGNVAYWRLANNLCDTAADNNTPNSNWWLYRWYADMEGGRLRTKIIDIPHSDFANVIKYNRDKFHYSKLTALSSMNEEKDKIEILCGGSDYASNIVIKNLGETKLENVDVKIESVCYEGLSGAVYAPATVRHYSDRVSLSGRLKIRLDSMDPTAVYRVTVTPSDGELEAYRNTDLPVRYEFERGTFFGTAYTYDSAYATTGELSGMCGGFEHDGDGVGINFDIDESGYYSVDLIYGNSNDGSSPDDRIDSQAIMTLDSTESVISFPNTIKSEYTDKYSFVAYFDKGSHSLKLSHKNGTFVVDSMIIRPYKEIEEISVLPDADRTKNGVVSYLAVAPYDGYFELRTDKDAEFGVDSAYGKTTRNRATVYLRRGLNYIDFSADKIECEIVASKKTVTPVTVDAADMLLSGSAEFCDGGYISGITADGGEAKFTVNAPESGSYRFTFTYSNNDEGGVHAYNVDLIERFVTVSVNGTSQNVWCRNTYSWDTYKTVTADIELAEGENTVTLSNNGEVVFNGRTPQAPHISKVTVNKTVITEGETQ